MSIFIIASIILYLICCVIIIYLFRYEGIINTGLILVLSATVYYVAIPVELFLNQQNSYILGGVYLVDLPYDMNALVMFLSSIAIISFSAGYKMSGFKLHSIILSQDNSNLLINKYSPVWKATKLLLFLLLLFYYSSETSYYYQQLDTHKILH